VQIPRDEHVDLLRQLGLSPAEEAAESDTGLGRGQASGLGMNLESEPEDPVDPLR